MAVTYASSVKAFLRARAGERTYPAVGVAPASAHLAHVAGGGPGDRPDVEGGHPVRRRGGDRFKLIAVDSRVNPIRPGPWRGLRPSRSSVGRHRWSPSCRETTTCLSPPAACPGRLPDNRWLPHERW